LLRMETGVPQSPSVCDSPEILILIDDICAAAWHDIQVERLYPPMWDGLGIRYLLARRIRTAIDQGERDPVLLKDLAVISIQTD
jgi:hypothetical protein